MFLSLLLSFVGFCLCAFAVLCVIGVVVRLLAWIFLHPLALLVALFLTFLALSVK